jgi:hypothetical protein
MNARFINLAARPHQTTLANYPKDVIIFSKIKGAIADSHALISQEFRAIIFLS